MLAGDVPDPFSTIANDDFLFGTAPAAFPGLDIEPLSELLRVLDGAGVGCREGIANPKALLIPLGLREHAAEFGLPGMRGQAVEFAFAARRFLLHHRYASAVHLQ